MRRLPSRSMPPPPNELLVRAALALDLDGDAVRLLRLDLEQHAYALEEADHALGTLLAEKVENA